MGEYKEYIIPAISFIFALGGAWIMLKTVIQKVKELSENLNKHIEEGKLIRERDAAKREVLEEKVQHIDKVISVDIASMKESLDWIKNELTRK